MAFGGLLGIKSLKEKNTILQTDDSVASSPARPQTGPDSADAAAGGAVKVDNTKNAAGGEPWQEWRGGMEAGVINALDRAKETGIEAKGAETEVEMQAPPPPGPPTRMPFRTRGLHSENSSNATSSCPGTPSSEYLKLTKRHSRDSRESRESGQSRQPDRHRRPDVRLVLEEKRTDKGRHRNDSDEVEGSASSVVSWWSSDQGEKPTRKKRDKKAEKQNAGLGWLDFCCLRNSDGCQRFEPIQEDHPETEFDHDVKILELHSVLRHHAIEPREGLVKDMLQWQARTTMPSSQHLAASPEFKV